MLDSSALIREAAATRLRPDDLFALQFLRGARLSVDARRVAYGISRTDADEHYEIWISELSGRDKTRLPFHGNAVAPRWSADGRHLAFVADGRLRVATLPSLQISEPLTPHDMQVQGAPSWHHDSLRLVVSLRSHRSLDAPRRVTRNIFRADGLGFLDELSQHLFQIDITGRMQALTSGAELCSDPQWSPCGRFILYFSTDEAIPFASYSPRLLSLDTASLQTSEVLGEGWFITHARWLPGSQRVIVTGAYRSTVTVPTVSLWVVDRSGANAQERTPAIAGNVGCRIHHDMPAWDLTQDNAATVLDETTAFVSTQRGGSVEIWRVALTGPTTVERILQGDRSCFVLDACARTRTLLYAVSDLRRPPELWCSTLEGAEEKRISGFNDSVLARWPEFQVTPFQCVSADGLQIDAWYIGAGRTQLPRPTVLFIHGGPFGSTGHAFRYDFLLLASQGLGVTFANFRGSAGYGEVFARAIMGDWGGRGFPDHMATVDTAASLGLADAERLGVWGASHGGFATCWIVGHTNRFKAALAEAAVTNFASLYYLTDAPEGFSRDLGGRPHEIPEIYRARSPMTYAHRCVTPTLLVHGEDDLRCPISEAEQFHRVLRDVGCTTELLRLPRCSHLGDSVGPLSVRRAQNQALVSWFAKYL